MKWEQGIFGFVSEAEWLNVGLDVTRPNDPIDGLFGDQKTDNLFAQWQTIASEYQVPMMAQFHGFDTEAKTTFRIPVDTHNIEKGLIKVKIPQSERLRELAKTMTTEQLYDYVLNDGIRLADQVETRTKVLKNELMARGKVTIDENNIDLEVDYGVPAAHVAYTIDLSTSADLPGQIQTIIDDARLKGVEINGMMTAKKNVSKMRRNDMMQTLMHGALGSGALIRNDEFKTFLESEFGISQIIEQDKTYGADAKIDENGRPQITTKRYFPDDKISFFATNSAGRMGVGLWGDPPEVTDGQFKSVAGSSINNFIFVSQWATKDPVITWTKASGLFMPVLYNPNSLYVATVTEGE